MLYPDKIGVKGQRVNKVKYERLHKRHIYAIGRLHMNPREVLDSKNDSTDLMTVFVVIIASSVPLTGSVTCHSDGVFCSWEPPRLNVL